MDSRAEHLAWAKERALEYVAIGDFGQAFTSLASDLGKHPETQGHGALQLGMLLLMSGQMSTARQAREFIEGVN